MKLAEIVVGTQLYCTNWGDRRWSGYHVLPLIVLDKQRGWRKVRPQETGVTEYVFAPELVQDNGGISVSSNILVAVQKLDGFWEPALLQHRQVRDIGLNDRLSIDRSQAKWQRDHEEDKVRKVRMDSFLFEIQDEFGVNLRRYIDKSDSYDDELTGRVSVSSWSELGQIEMDFPTFKEVLTAAVKNHQ